MEGPRNGPKYVMIVTTGTSKMASLIYRSSHPDNIRISSKPCQPQGPLKELEAPKPQICAGVEHAAGRGAHRAVEAQSPLAARRRHVRCLPKGLDTPVGSGGIILYCIFSVYVCGYVYICIYIYVYYVRHI